MFKQLSGLGNRALRSFYYHCGLPPSMFRRVFILLPVLFVLGRRPGCGCQFWSGQAECMTYNLARE
jgi:hypothetical protein